LFILIHDILYKVYLLDFILNMKTFLKSK